MLKIWTPPLFLILWVKFKKSGRIFRISLTLKIIFHETFELQPNTFSFLSSVLAAF